MVIKVSNTNQPNWTDLNVHANLPKNLNKLQEIATNLWWVWNSDAKNIFRCIDLDAWHQAQSNPIVLLNTISYERMLELSKDKKFMAQLDKTYAEFRAYMDEPKDPRTPLDVFHPTRARNALLRHSMKRIPSHPASETESSPRIAEEACCTPQTERAPRRRLLSRPHRAFYDQGLQVQTLRFRK